MYKIAKEVLFRLDAETAHDLTMNCLGIANRSGLLSVITKPKIYNPVEILGLQFPNRVGLAAGMDKNGECISAFSSIGFGFVEVGTVTPRPQSGNAKPRIFRLPKDRAVINRLGFNNKGVDFLVERIKNRNHDGVLGVNIGKNFDTPLENATEDYKICFSKAAPFADYITVNVSSPNTLGLRSLQAVDQLKDICESLLELNEKESICKPILVKLSPDLSHEELVQTVGYLKISGVSGVIATNTTIDRSGLVGACAAEEKGGLSGEPLFEKSLSVVRNIREILGEDFPIIGVGGIHSSESAKMMVQAGANLVQVYTALIYRGPSLVSDIAQSLN